MRPFVLVSCLLALAACGTKATPGAISKGEVAAIEVAVTAAERSAGACLTARIGPCGVPATRAVIIRDAHAAHDAVKQLQASPAPTTMSAAQIALDRIVADIPATPVGK